MFNCPRCPSSEISIDCLEPSDVTSRHGAQILRSGDRRAGHQVLEDGQVRFNMFIASVAPKRPLRSSR